MRASRTALPLPRLQELQGSGRPTRGERCCRCGGHAPAIPWEYNAEHVAGQSTCIAVYADHCPQPTPNSKAYCEKRLKKCGPLRAKHPVGNRLGVDPDRFRYGSSSPFPLIEISDCSPTVAEKNTKCFCREAKIILTATCKCKILMKSLLAITKQRNYDFLQKNNFEVTPLFIALHSCQTSL